MKKLLVALIVIGILMSVPDQIGKWIARNYGKDKIYCQNNSMTHKTNSTGKVKFILTAKQLYDAYEENGVKAAQRYKGEVVTISGVIQDISWYRSGISSFMDYPYITLGWKESSPFGEIECRFSRSNEVLLRNFRKGESLSIKGEVQDKIIFSVYLNKCIPIM